MRREDVYLRQRFQKPLSAADLCFLFPSPPEAVHAGHAVRAGHCAGGPYHRGGQRFRVDGRQRYAIVMLRQKSSIFGEERGLRQRTCDARALAG